MEGTPALPPPRYARRLRVDAAARLPELRRGRPLRQAEVPGRRSSRCSPAADRAAHRALPRTHGRAARRRRPRRARRRRAEAPRASTTTPTSSSPRTTAGSSASTGSSTRAARTGSATGVKFFPYEGSSRVPLMAAGPGLPGAQEGPRARGQRRPRAHDRGHHRREADAAPGRHLAAAAPRASRRGWTAAASCWRRSRTRAAAPPYTAIRTKRYRYEAWADRRGGALRPRARSVGAAERAQRSALRADQGHPRRPRWRSCGTARGRGAG